MKTLASKLAIIFDELKQHNSMQLPLPPSSLSMISSTPHSSSPCVIAAPPFLPNTRHHTLSPVPQQTSGSNGVFVCALASRTKSLSEGDAIGQTRNSASNNNSNSSGNSNNIFTRPDDVWPKPRHERPSIKEINSVENFCGFIPN